MAISVTRLLRSKGHTIPLHKSVQTSYVVASGGYDGGAIQTFQFTGVFINFDNKEVDGATVLVTDKKLLIDADSLSAIPAVGDIVQGSLVNGQIKGGSKIMSVREIAPRGSVVAYTCQVR